MNPCPVCGADPRTPRCPSLVAVFEREERGERPGRGGPRKDAGRPTGSTTRLPAAEVGPALDQLRGDGTDADLARRLGVTRQAVAKARRLGLTERQLSAWREALTSRTGRSP